MAVVNLTALYGAPTGAMFWLLRPMPEGLCSEMPQSTKRHIAAT